MAASGSPIPLDMSETFFASPIQTLSESLKDPGQDWITAHDLVEAYNVLSARIRFHIHDILKVDNPLLSLAIFKAQSSQIAECISRDLERLLPSPFESNHASRSCYSDGSLSDDELYIATNNTTLCHHALRFMTDIFTFQSLYSNFTNDQLSTLLNVALSLCKIPEVPLLNPGKIYAMVIWTLKVQQLPLPVLVREKRNITSTLQNMITLEFGGDIVKLDAFKAIHCILKQHPIFVDDFLVLLPFVLDHLTFGPLAIRCNAAMALSGFTLAKLHSPTISNYLRGRIFELVQSYVDGQTSRQNSLGADIRLPAVFQTALASESFWEEKGPSFAISVTSCLIVLLDYSFYSSPRSLKFIFSVFARCSCHHQKFIRAFQPHMWKLAIWAFSRIPITVTDEDDDQTDISTILDLRDRAYLILRQDLRHGVGTTLVTALLNTGEPEEDRESATNDVQKALECAAALVNSDNVSEITEGYEILCRFMSGIGIPPSLLRNDDLGSPIIAPSAALIDGSLLGSSVGSIAILPQAASIEQVRPLSETEASVHWEMLSKIWVSLVQQFLSDLMPELSSGLVHIWQGLLLVQAQLTQEHLHLTSSSSFAVKVASIISKISTPLEQADAQTRYLSFIGKLWGVMKNVFKSSWLCSPAEIILATLLKRQFSFSDGQVKDLWSQLCTDLIAVKIPTVLHVLHVRSESQEDTEVTRQLWLILANDGLATGEEDWMSLLYFLVMPFGVWVMSSIEIEKWDVIFDRAIVVASKTAQTKDIVVSHFLKLLGEAKLVSLKQTPALLKTLLRVSSTGDSTLNIDLLTSVDAVLVSSYCHSDEHVELGLDLLHFLGGLIPMVADSEFVQFLSSLQAGMTMWIIDKDTLLSDDQHKDLIIGIYCASLDKLALLEPSITILNAIAPFIQSVFVRVRGHGPLAFQTFWRATYHTRLDIPKKDYPLLIQTCLKAWADFCEDSLADGISLDSLLLTETQLTVPDSQSEAFASFNEGSSAFEFFEQPNTNDADADADIVNLGIEYTSDNSRSQGTVTPIQRSRRQSPLDHSIDIPSRLNTNVLEENFIPELQDPNNSSTPERHHSSDAVTISGTKRAADLDLHLNKRRKSNPRTPKVRKGRASNPELYAPDAQFSKLSTSTPVTRTSTALFAPTHFHSQPFESGRRTEKDRPSSSPDRPEQKSPSGSTYDHSDYVLKGSPVPEPIVNLVDDYNSWEQNVSAEDLEQVQEALQNHSDSGMEDDSTEEMGDFHHLDDENILSPSLSEYPLRSRRRERSQTAPQLINESSHPMYPQPLRRNQTSPLKSKASSTQLDALQHAYAVIADMGTSQVDVQDIMQAKRLAHQINQVLDEQMCAKFGAHNDIQGGIG